MRVFTHDFTTTGVFRRSRPPRRLRFPLMCCSFWRGVIRRSPVSTHTGGILKTWRGNYGGSGLKTQPSKTSGTFIAFNAEPQHAATWFSFSLRWVMGFAVMFCARAPPVS